MTCDCIGVAEVAALLGVTKQRAHQLSRYNAAFPAPVKRLRATPLYSEAEIRAFAALERPSGRPAAPEQPETAPMSPLTAREAIALMARTCGHPASDLLVMNGGYHCRACRVEAGLAEYPPTPVQEQQGGEAL